MLHDDLEAEPRTTVARMHEMYRRHAAAPRFTRDVAEAVASGSPVLARGGAWMLQQHLAEGGELSAGEWEIVGDGLAGVTDWIARLQLCQAAARQPDKFGVEPELLAEFLRECARDKVPFVRAWAVDAFHQLGRRHPALRAEAGRFVARARRDPAKSVQARIRHLEDGKRTPRRRARE